jgi:hypothetical protein
LFLIYPPFRAIAMAGHDVALRSLLCLLALVGVAGAGVDDTFDIKTVQELRFRCI